ncbi:MAG: tetratricopeptide repeat protein, partial [Victivallales bacterium]
MFVHLPEKSLILLSVTVCGFFLCTVSASDIVSDTQQEEPDAVWEITPSKQEERSIENNTAFYAVLNELSRTRSFTDAQIKKLFEVLDKTPDSPFLAANLLSELRLNNKAGLLTEQFSALAQKHPSRFMLTAIAADLLQMQKRNQDAIALLRKAADYLMAAEDRDELLHRQPNYAEYILLKLAILLAMEKDYESSEKLIQEIASWKNLKDNLFLKQLSLINCAAMLKTAPDSRFLWIFPSEKEKMREKFDRTAEEYLKELAAIQEKGENVDLRKNNAALSLLALENHSGADSVILGNLLNNPADASSMLYLAEHYTRRQEPALAARVWKQIFRMTQNQPLWFYLAYGNALAAAGMTGEAVSLYELALLMAPADNNLKLRIGQLLYGEGKYQEALNAVREVPMPAARYLAALCCHFLGKPEESLKFFKAFFESPQDAGSSAPDYIPFLYAENAEKTKRYRLAEQIARDCLKKNPDSPDA